MKTENKTPWTKMIVGSVISAVSIAVVNEVSHIVIEKIKKKLDERKENKR